MLMAVTYLILLSQFPLIISSLRTCVPNSQFQLNEKLCYCDSFGQWSEANCIVTQRSILCQPGQVTWQDCNQCICKDNGQFSCSTRVCSDHPSTNDDNFSKYSYTVIPWCTPFRSYYTNCSICVCPASGRMIEARCVADSSCSVKNPPSNTDLQSKNNLCIPKVVYIFPCIQCLCSDDGFFIFDKCVETCERQQNTESTRRCIPKTIYRKDCNVCRCPDTGLHDSKLCTKAVCDDASISRGLLSLRSKTFECLPHIFTKPKCIYCDCTPDGIIDENACLEQDCLDSANLNYYDIAKQNCSPGELVPICMECLCLHDGLTNDKYCTRTCSYRSKLKIIETIVKNKGKSDVLLNRVSLRNNQANDLCEPNSVYIDQRRYCICPDNGFTNFNLCTDGEQINSSKVIKSKEYVDIDFDSKCEPSTFVNFDCNTCFCSKNGTIDPKWCTYDDCESKRIIQKSRNIDFSSDAKQSDNCIPGSISKVECNFCICPENGVSKDNVCTKNDCSLNVKSLNNDKFLCEPLGYYEVDCNVCYCPRDGLKNVAVCTKNHCEKSFLRSDVCVPGQLFSDECKVCVCPPNGNKLEKACTNCTCTDSAPWKKIFQLSESLLGNQIAEGTRNLDVCFPGEEFVEGCKLCVCPDMGLRVYATCSPMLCEDEHLSETTTSGIDGDYKVLQGNRMRRKEDCVTYNLTIEAERAECTPGSMYIIRCRQCICPYMGNINNFCRPMPDDFVCEQAFPNFNYVPMGRRHNDANATNSTSILPTNSTRKHDHTKYHCDKPGKIMDECFICECEEGLSLVEEHCFRSDHENCSTAIPSFLKK